MLKKLGIASAIASVITVGTAGVALASDHGNHHWPSHHHHTAGIDCSSTEYSEQNNYGDQLIGGNITLRNISGFIGGVIDRPAVCPKVLNNITLVK